MEICKELFASKMFEFVKCASSQVKPKLNLAKSRTSLILKWLNLKTNNFFLFFLFPGKNPISENEHKNRSVSGNPKTKYVNWILIIVQSVIILRNSI